MDGQCGPLTRRTLQKRLGVPTDGVWGPATTRALQRALERREATMDSPFAMAPLASIFDEERPVYMTPEKAARALMEDETAGHPHG